MSDNNEDKSNNSEDNKESEQNSDNSNKDNSDGIIITDKEEKNNKEDNEDNEESISKISKEPEELLADLKGNPLSEPLINTKDQPIVKEDIDIKTSKKELKLKQQDQPKDLTKDQPKQDHKKGLDLIKDINSDLNNIFDNLAKKVTSFGLETKISNQWDIKNNSSNQIGNNITKIKREKEYEFNFDFLDKFKNYSPKAIKEIQSTEDYLNKKIAQREKKAINDKKEDVRNIPYIIEKDKKKFDEQVQVSFVSKNNIGIEDNEYNNESYNLYPEYYDQDEIYQQKVNKINGNQRKNVINVNKINKVIKDNTTNKKSQSKNKSNKNNYRSIEDLYSSINEKQPEIYSNENSEYNKNSIKVKNFAQINYTLNKKYLGENNPKYNNNYRYNNQPNYKPSIHPNYQPDYQPNYYNPYRQSVNINNKQHNLQNAMEVLLSYNNTNTNAYNTYSANNQYNAYNN